MSDQEPTDGPPDPSTPSEPATQPGRLARWRSAAGEGLRRTRVGLAVALAAALLLGGVGGFALGIVTADRDGPDGDRRWGDHPSRLDGADDGDRQAPPPGAPGQLPPTTREDRSDLQG